MSIYDSPRKHHVLFRLAASRPSSIYLYSYLSRLRFGLGLVGSGNACSTHGNHQIVMTIDVEVGATHERSSSTDIGPVGSIDDL